MSSPKIKPLWYRIFLYTNFPYGLFRCDNTIIVPLSCLEWQLNFKSYLGPVFYNVRAEIHKAVLPQFSLVEDFLIIKVRVTYFFAPLDFFLLMGHHLLFIWESEDEFLVRKVMSLEGVWYELSVTLQSTSYQTPSKLITFLTKNSPSGDIHMWRNKS